MTPAAVNHERPPAVEAVRATRRGLALSLAAAATALAFAVAISQVSGVAPFGTSPLSVVVLFGVGASGLAVVFGNRRTLDGRAAGMTGLAMLGWLPALFLWKLLFFPTPVARASLSAYPLNPLDFLCSIPVFLGVFLFLSSRVARTALGSRFDRPMRTAAATGLGVVAIATVLGLAWSGRPDGDGFRASLPGFSLAVGGSFDLEDGARVEYTPGPPCVGPSTAWDCCALSRIEEAHKASCSPLIVRHSTRERVWIVNEQALSVGDGHVDERPVAAFKASEKRSRDLLPADVAHSISPPIGWTLGAGVGFLLGAALFASGFWLEKRRASLAGWVDGTLHPGGSVFVAEVSPLQLAAPGLSAPAAVHLRLRHEGAAGYRDMEHVAIEGWGFGTLDSARAKLQGRAASRYALALTAALLSAAPLLVTGLGGAR
jgi:hypothetical protein